MRPVEFLKIVVPLTGHVGRNDFAIGDSVAVEVVPLAGHVGRNIKAQIDRDRDRDR